MKSEQLSMRLKLPGIILLSGSDGGIPGYNAIPKKIIEELVRSGFISSARELRPGKNARIMAIYFRVRKIIAMLIDDTP